MEKGKENKETECKGAGTMKNGVFKRVGCKKNSMRFMGQGGGMVSALDLPI